MNIENTSTSNGHHSTSPFFAVRSANNVSNVLPGTNNLSLNNIGNDNQSNHYFITPDGSLPNNNQQTSNNWQSSHISHTVVGDINKETANLSHNASVSIDIRNNSSNFHHEQLDLSTSFRERYEYPENSLYYHSNQLLYNLFRERQMRQNDSAS